MAKVGKLSASKITCYKGCSLAYYLKYIAREDAPASGRLAFGKAVHYMLNRFYKLNYKSQESFVKAWNYYWRAYIAGDFIRGNAKEKIKREEHRIRDDFIITIGSHVNLGSDPTGVFFGYRKEGEKILRRFYERHKPKTPPTMTEKSFGVKNDKPVEIAGQKIRGVFDRIDEIDGKAYITDYKTDKRSPADDSFGLHRNPQFTLYSYAFRQLFQKEEEAVLYYHLRSGRVFKTHRSEKDYDYMRRLVEDVAEGIANDRFVPFYGFHCSFCDHKLPCEKYSIEHHGGPSLNLEGKIREVKEFTEWDIPNWMEMQADE